MTGSQDYRAEELFSGLCFYADNLLILNNQSGHLRFKIYFSTTFKDRVPHILNHSWQLIRADMWMGIDENRGGCPMLTEHVQYLFYVSAFLTSGI